MKQTNVLTENLKKQKTTAFRKDIYLLGMDSEGQNYWLEAPSWDCGWYWGFGYVETYTNNEKPHLSKDINSHEHISGFMGEQQEYNFDKGCFVKGEYVHNLIDSKRFAATTFNKKGSWELSELFNQFYFLQKAAENFKNGKCYTSNAAINTWEKPELVKEINEQLIPQVTARILEILSPVQSA